MKRGALDTEKMYEEARESYLKQLALLKDKYNQALSKIKREKEPQTLKQIKCPNCGAGLDTRRFVPNGYIKCKYCRSEFELCGSEE